MLHYESRRSELARELEARTAVHPSAAPHQKSRDEFADLRLPPLEAGPPRTDRAEGIMEARDNAGGSQTIRRVAAIGTALGAGVLLFMTSPSWGLIAGGLALIGAAGWLALRSLKGKEVLASPVERDLAQVAESKQNIVRSAVRIRRSPVEGAADVATLALNFCLKLDKLSEAIRKEPAEYGRTVGLFKNVPKVERALSELSEVLGARTRDETARYNAVGAVRDMLRETLACYEQTYENIHKSELNQVQTSVRTVRNVMEAYAPAPQIEPAAPVKEPENKEPVKQKRQAMRY